MRTANLTIQALARRLKMAGAILVGADRQIATSGLLSGGGDLSADRTLSIQLSTGARVVGRQTGAGAGAASELDVSHLDTILDASVTPGASRIPRAESGAGSSRLSKEWVEPHTTVGAFITNPSGDADWISFAAASSIVLQKTTSGTPVAVRIGTGSTFPGTPADGQPYHHPTLFDWFVRVDGSSGWVGSEVLAFPFYFSADTAATAYADYGHSSGAAFTDTFGFQVPYQCRVWGISLAMAASGTATVQVFDDGSGVTSATLALSSQTKKSSWGPLGGNIAADSICGLKVTSGTVEGPATGIVYLRRFET